VSGEFFKAYPQEPLTPFNCNQSIINVMPHDREMKVLRPFLEKYENVEDHVKVKDIVTTVRERDHHDKNYERKNVRKWNLINFVVVM